MTTPGREALFEAMRLEQARIYGRLQPEQKSRDDTPARVAASTAATSNVTRLALPRTKDVA